MTRPRLLYVAHQYENLGGVERLTHLLRTGLRDRYEVDVVYPVGDSLRRRNEHDVVAEYPAEKIPWPVTPHRSARMEQAFARVLAEVKPDVIHIQHLLNWPLSVIDQAATAAPVVLSFHDAYTFSPRFTMEGAATSEESFTEAYSRKAYNADLRPYLERRRQVMAESLKKVRARVAVSRFIGREVNRIYPGDFRVIENGIEPFERLPRVEHEAFRFGYLGGLFPQKGWQSLYDAFAEVRRKHPRAELHIHGGPVPAGVSRDGVTFHGAYQPADVPRIAAALDVGVIPSTFPETYSLVLSEWWQAGLPVAVSDIGALAERVSDGVNGKLFRPGDPASIAEALCWFLEHEEWKRWTLPVPRTSTAMVDEHDRLYRELLEPRPGGSLPHEEPNLLIVQLCDFLDDGDRYYRYQMPSRHLARQPGVTVLDCHYLHRLIRPAALAADILVLQFVYDWDFFALIEERRAAGKVTVFEANDYFYDIQPWNPIAERWQDRAVREAFRHFIRTADAVQTSSDWLAEQWRKWNPNVHVFENQLAEVSPPASPLRRPLTIGWGGSPGHFADWYHVAPVLQRWLDRHPKVRLSVMTSDFAKPFFRLPPDRYQFTPFGTMGAYQKFLSTLDIGLAPLLPSDYNRGRSDVKFLEYASAGVAGIYADLNPYQGKVAHGETGLVYRTPEELTGCLDRLASDAQLRDRIRRQAFEHVAGTRRIEQHIGHRLEVYRSLLRGPARGGPLPEAVLTAAHREGSYLQLRPQALEQAMEAAQSSPQAIETLAGLVNQAPDYVPGIVHIGRTLNDRKENAQARNLLERAKAQSTSASVVSELARAEFVLGNTPRARSLLEEALALNPLHHPAWMYLMRLLALQRTADGPAWAARSRELFPHSFRLALLGVPAHSPPEQLKLLKQLIDQYALSLSREERAGAVKVFGEAILEAVRTLPDDEASIALLRQACSMFPESARLAHELGQALHRAGHEAESLASFTREREVRRQTSMYVDEFPQEDGNVLYWFFADHIRRWAPS